MSAPMATKRLRNDLKFISQVCWRKDVCQIRFQNREQLFEFYILFALYSGITRTSPFTTAGFMRRVRLFGFKSAA